MSMKRFFLTFVLVQLCAQVTGEAIGSASTVTGGSIGSASAMPSMPVGSEGAIASPAVASVPVTAEAVAAIPSLPSKDSVTGGSIGSASAMPSMPAEVQPPRSGEEIEADHLVERGLFARDQNGDEDAGPVALGPRNTIEEPVEEPEPECEARHASTANCTKHCKFGSSEMEPRSHLIMPLSHTFS
eukprot:Skav231958  [mRNA]  locus=scaffold2806:101473:104807:- [translate_table: standard]